MSKIPHVQMLVPGLSGPLPGIQHIVDDDGIKNIFSELSKANVETIESDDLYSLLIKLFALDAKNQCSGDNFPAAALSLLGCTERQDKGEFFLSGDDVNALGLNENYFLHADPVHLRAEMDHAVLVGTQDLNLASAEAKELSGKLHQHFKEDGVDVFAMDASHWYVKIRTPQDVRTVKLSDAVGRNVNFILPSGKDETYWKQFLNESQMLLHMHDNNEQRESHGQLPVNSVWLHGGGVLSGLHSTGNVSSGVSSVCCDDMLLLGVAKYCHLSACHPLDNAQDFYLRIREQEAPLLYIDSLLPWLNYTDTQMWQQQLEKIYALWLKPLLTMVKQGKLTLSLYPCNNKMYSFRRHYNYRFWRNAKIEDYVSTY